MDPLESILLGGLDKHTYVSSLLSEEETIAAGFSW